MIELLPELCNASFKCTQLVCPPCCCWLRSVSSCCRSTSSSLAADCAVSAAAPVTPTMRRIPFAMADSSIVIHTPQSMSLLILHNTHIYAHTVYYLGERKPLPRGCSVCVCPRRTPLNTSSRPPAAPHLPAVHHNIIIDVLSLELE